MKNEIFSEEDLKRLYKSYPLYLMTKYMIYCKRYNKDIRKKNDTKEFEEYEFLYFNNDYTGYMNHAHDTCFFDSIVISNCQNNLSICKDDNERFFLNMRQSAYKLAYDTVKYFGTSPDLKYCDNPQNIYHSFDADRYEQFLEELHENDDYCIENEMPTRSELVKFVWQYLKYCDLDELRHLLKRADEKFERKSNAGRKAFKKTINVYDLSGKLLHTFNSRKECVEQLGIKKSTLSKLLNSNTKLKFYRNMKFEEV